MKPVPSSPVTAPVIGNYLDFGSRFQKVNDGSTYSKATHYISKDDCDQEDFLHLGASFTLNHLDNCSSYTIATGSIKLGLPHNANGADLTTVLAWLKSIITSQVTQLAS